MYNFRSRFSCRNAGDRFGLIKVGVLIFQKSALYFGDGAFQVTDVQLWSDIAQ